MKSFLKLFQKPFTYLEWEGVFCNPKQKFFPHLFYRDIDVFAKKNNPSPLMQRIKGNMTIREKCLSKNFIPSPIPNGRGQFLSLFHKFLKKTPVAI